MRILVLAPHTDDMEFGCGGTIAKLSKDNDVYCLPFTHCGLPQLMTESANAAKILNVELLANCKYPVRRFHEHRQSILDKMISIRDKHTPDMIFTPARNDIHQDHSVVTEEALRAFKFCSILGYELTWNNYFFNTSYFVELTLSELHTKILSIEQYKSQSKRPYANEDFINSLARVRGTQINKKYAEAFDLIRMIHE